MLVPYNNLEIFYLVLLSFCEGILFFVVVNFGSYLKAKLLFVAYISLKDVEWGFSFDVHLNAFFPILVILHFVQLFVYHIFIGKLIPL
jgi:hypothetical protein